jgi:hypothetical protein
LKIFEAGKWEEAEIQTIFEPIPFSGEENMLVDSRARAVKDEEDEDS